MSQYSVENCLNSKVITYTKCLVVPGRTRLSSSYGYAGITSGAVEITDILDVSSPDNYEKLQAYIGGNIDSIEGIQRRDTSIYDELVEYYKTCEYVEYNYPGSPEEGVLYMDIKTFMDHTSEL